MLKCAHKALILSTVIVTDTNLFTSHRANALKCNNCGVIVAVEVRENGNPVMKMIEATAKCVTAG